jgi:transcriptional regulator with GAF, ATPase, and Fis domain
MTVSEFQNTYGIIGSSKEIRDLTDIVMQVAQSDITVLITGESGVGKEIFANAIHKASQRADKPMVSVNCGAIPEGILDSELFGHKKGSFTGAVETRKGYFELADSGTLFLDEIAEMPIPTQVKLLRAIETSEFMKVGAETITKVNVRYIAATNKDLQEEVDAKRFREDLFFRLKAVTLHVPPLRKRKADIGALALHFLRNFEKENKIPNMTLSDDAVDLLTQYHWPGNVRELKNAVETAAALSRDGFLDSTSFQPLLKIVEKETNRNLPVALNKSPEQVDREFIYRALFEIKKDILDLKDMMLEQQHEHHHITVDDSFDELLTMQELERKAIVNALKKAGGNKRKTALMLNISERTLYRKMKEYDIH